jgi:glycine/D-amino acid oxidase-like deaminating enzyme
MSQPNINTFAPDSSYTKSTTVFPQLSKSNTITVIGAGAFGGWTALYLLRQGFRVTLIDAWGAGNSRSSSGDETRVIRSTYGANELYFDLNVRSLELWKENQEAFEKKLFYNNGVLWFCYEESTPIVDDSIPFSQKHNILYERLSSSELKKRFPVINTEDMHHAYLDTHGGYLKARESCMAVFDAFIKEGGDFIQTPVFPGKITNGRMQNIVLQNGNTITSDAFIFACGSWLGKIFPDVLGNVITCTKQEVYYFGVPAEQAYALENFPTWIDVDGKDFYYGTAGNANRGFKIGVDKRGEAFDPSHSERCINPEVLSKARAFISHRFPSLQNAPLLENRVCPYENSPDGNFIFDLHPEAENLLFLGGGSGHGFKHGPALGELVANVLSGKAKAPSLFSIKK